MSVKAKARYWRMTVDWAEGGKYGAGWSRTFDGDVTVPDGVSNDALRDYIYEQATKDGPAGGQIVRFELDGEVLVDQPLSSA